DLRRRIETDAQLTRRSGNERVHGRHVFHIPHPQIHAHAAFGRELRVATAARWNRAQRMLHQGFRVTRRLAKCPPDPSPTQRPIDPRVRSLSSLTTRLGSVPPLTKTLTFGRSTTT